MFKFNVGTRIIYNRNDVKYLGQIIDARTRDGINDYYIKFDNTHAFCHYNHDYDGTVEAIYRWCRETDLKRSKKQIKYCTEDMVVTVGGKIVPKAICHISNIKGNEVYFLVTELDLFFVCNCCGNIHKISEKATIYEEDIKICKNCVSETREFFKCNRCEIYYRISDKKNYNGKEVCKYCLAEEIDCIDGYHTFKGRGLRRGYTFFGNTYNNSVPYMGFELETENSDGEYVEAKICASEIHSIFNDIPISTEEDGSLDDGFELITSPMTYEFHNKLSKEYTEVMETYNKYNMISNNHCGLHVHINRNYFDDVDAGILNILTIFDKFWHDLERFSRRDINRLDRWAKKPSGTPEQFLNESKRGRTNRYSAVNLCNDNTIEFRIFKSTTDWDILDDTLSLVNNIAIISKYLSNDKIKSLTWEDLTSKDFSNSLIASFR